MSLLHQETTSFYCFAHQDDESGIFHQIENDLNFGVTVICIFFTCNSDPIKSLIRNSESRIVLSAIGVLEENIIFIGDNFQVYDQHLIDHMYVLYHWFKEIVLNSNHNRNIYCPAWEGGHPDHDALNVICALTVNSICDRSVGYQFSLYNKKKCPGPFFKVLAPLNENGQIISYDIPILRRVRYLIYCLKYKSQWKSWLGLLPMFVLYYAFDGRQKLQFLSVSRLFEKPHDGMLYYEARSFAVYPELDSKIKEFLELISYCDRVI
jgi:hypothetical protein